MNFGDILDEWERQNTGVRGKGASRGSAGGRKETKPRKKGALPPAQNGALKKTDPLTAWLRIHGVYDKDAEEEARGGSPGERRRRLSAKRPDAVIDLHGLTRDETWNNLEQFFQDARIQGFEKLLIIHGKGNHSEKEGVLKETVRKFIENCPFAGESGRQNASAGGQGATWVFLKGAKKAP
ncbi:MAG: Smr/MutS family protein [Treponema sp.]|jgi:DNA-nicking Smr family endonuclease|nr:Smr/MutS family protein [Treponema sp.]